MIETLSAFDLLEGDHNGMGLRQMQDALLAMKTRIRTGMDKGLSPDEFAVAQKALLSVETASETVERLHDKIAG